LIVFASRCESLPGAGSFQTVPWVRILAAKNRRRCVVFAGRGAWRREYLW